MSLWSNDAIWSRVFRLCSWCAAGVLVLIVVFLWRESASAWTSVGTRFVTDDSWHPAAKVDQGEFNLLPALLGSVAVSVLAIVLAGPLGMAIAIYRVFVGHRWVTVVLRRTLEVAAGVPSVVFGLWGLTSLVPLIAKWQPPGASLFAGGIVLALMILPTIALMADSVFTSFPQEQLIAARGLGLSTQRIVMQIVLPASRRSLLTVHVLGIVRALGETMAVLMVAGNVVQYPKSLFAPVRTLTASIALEMGYALDSHRAALFCCGLILLSFVLLLVLATEALGRRTEHVG